jgi:hypothetical protein
MVNSKILLSSQRLCVNQTSSLGSDLSRTAAAYTICAVTSLLPSIYDYAGAHNAVNPALYNRDWSTNPFFSKENPLLNNLESLQEEFTGKLAAAFGAILKYCNTSNVFVEPAPRTNCRRASCCLSEMALVSHHQAQLVRAGAFRFVVLIQ